MIFLISSFIYMFVTCGKTKKEEFYFFKQIFLLRLIWSQSPRSSLSLLYYIEVYDLEVGSSPCSQISVKYGCDICHSPVPSIRETCTFFTASHQFYIPFLSTDLNMSHLIFQKCEQCQNHSKHSLYCQKEEVYFFLTFSIRESCIQFTQLLFAI